MRGCATLPAVAAAAAAAAAVLAAGAGAGAADPARDSAIRAFSDAKTVPRDSTVLSAMACPQAVRAATDPMRPSQALESAEAFLRRTVGEVGLSAFSRSSAARSADAAGAAAVVAVAANRPAAALAAALRAVELRPGEQRHLLTASSLLAQLGLPREALALADAAGRARPGPRRPFGLEPSALVALARGNALLGLGRYAKAEAALRAAVRDPLLAEARASLATTLLCRRKRREALRFGALAARRRAFVDLVETRDGDRTPTEAVFDLSQGVEGRFPALEFPGTVEKAVASWRPLERALQDTLARRVALDRQWSALYTAAISDRSLTALTRERMLHVRQHMNGEDESLRRLQRTADALKVAASRYVEGGQVGPTCASIRNHSAFWSTLSSAYVASRAYALKKYRFQTAVAANIANPRFHRALNLSAKSYLLLVYEGVLQLAAWYARNEALAPPECRSRAGAPQAADSDVDVAQSRPCSRFLRGVFFRLTLPGLKIDVNCEEVSLELKRNVVELKWLELGVFAKAGWKHRTGETTIFAGPRAKIGSGGFGGSAKDGVYVRFDGSGNVKDVGMRVEFQGEAGAGTVVKVTESMDFTLVGAFGGGR